MPTRRELGEYYKALGKMTYEERRAEKEKRYKEMMDQGMRATEALRTLESEEAEGKTILREMAKEGREPEGESNVLWKGSKVEDEEPYGEEEPLDVSKDEELLKEKLESGEEEYLKTREKIASGLKETEAIGKGIVGVGSRTPIKEALISGAAKLVTSLKGTPKTPEEVKREKKFRALEEHARRMAEAKSSGRRSGRYVGESPLQLKDLGRGDMGTKEFGSTRNPVGSFGSGKTPDFLGASSFNMGTKNPLGKSGKQSPMKPPSTSISYGGGKAPSTSIPFGGNKPPSVSIPSGGNKPPSTSFGFSGSSIGDLVDLKPKGKPKTDTKQKTQKKGAEEILGLKGYF